MEIEYIIIGFSNKEEKLKAEITALKNPIVQSLVCTGHKVCAFKFIDKSFSGIYHYEMWFKKEKKECPELPNAQQS